jgi:hypothetical protein
MPQRVLWLTITPPKMMFLARLGWLTINERAHAISYIEVRSSSDA